MKRLFMSEVSPMSTCVHSLGNKEGKGMVKLLSHLHSNNQEHYFFVSLILFYFVIRQCSWNDRSILILSLINFEIVLINLASKPVHRSVGSNIIAYEDE